MGKEAVRARREKERRGGSEQPRQRPEPEAPVATQGLTRRRLLQLGLGSAVSLGVGASILGVLLPRGGNDRVAAGTDAPLPVPPSRPEPTPRQAETSVEQKIADTDRLIASVERGLSRFIPAMREKISKHGDLATTPDVLQALSKALDILEYNMNTNGRKNFPRFNQEMKSRGTETGEIIIMDSHHFFYEAADLPAEIGAAVGAMRRLKMNPDDHNIEGNVIMFKVLHEGLHILQDSLRRTSMTQDALDKGDERIKELLKASGRRRVTILNNEISAWGHELEAFNMFLDGLITTEMAKAKEEAEPGKKPNINLNKLTNKAMSILGAAPEERALVEDHIVMSIVYFDRNPGLQPDQADPDFVDAIIERYTAAGFEMLYEDETGQLSSIRDTKR